jgi:hypothetical protein
VAQAVENLPSKYEALISNASTAKKKKKDIYPFKGVFLVGFLLLLCLVF